MDNTPSSGTLSSEIYHQRLLCPFPPSDIQVKSTNSTSHFVYTEVWPVINRLSAVFGIDNISICSDVTMAHENWVKSGYKNGNKTSEQGEGLRTCVRVTIEVRWPNGNITKVTDFGECSSEMNDNQNKVSTAYAQALKRAAAKIGVGAYLWNYGTLSSPNAVTPEATVEALKNANFKFKCEVTGTTITLDEAWASMRKFGKVLSKEAVKNAVP